MKKIFFVLFLSTGGIIHAQNYATPNMTNSSGGSGVAAGTYYDYSIGEPILGSGTTSCKGIYAGFQHCAFDTFSVSTTTITVTGATTFCAGNSVTLAAASGASWLWSNGATSQNITVTTAGNYFVSVYNSCGDQLKSDTITVSVNPLPSTPGAISGPLAICPDQNNVSFFVNPVTNATSYNWILSSGAIVTAGNGTNAVAVDFPLSSTSTFIYVQGVNTCGTGPASPAYQLNVYTLPALNAGNNTTLCQGQNLSLNASGSGSFLWSGPNSFSASGSSATVNNIQPLSSGNYSVILTDGNNCKNYDTIAVTVNPLPAAAGIISGATQANICPLSTGVLYSVNAISDATQYNWTIPSGAMISGGNSADSITVDFQLNSQSGTITVQGQNSCGTGASSSLSLIFNGVLIPQICMVTVDTSGANHNVVYWDTTGFAGIDTFLIQREVTTNVYQTVGKVAYGDSPEFADMTSTPTGNTYRYKLGVIDTCGNHADTLSYFHNTIYMGQNNGTFNWSGTQYKIENVATPVSYYVLERDSLSNGIWDSIKSCPGTQYVMTDPNWGNQVYARWRVTTVWGISCDGDIPATPGGNAIHATVRKSRSNIQNNRINTINGKQEFATTNFFVYPNPANNQITIKQQSPLKNSVVEVRDVMGRVVLTQRITNTTTTVTLDISELNSGVYFIVLSSNNSTSIKKIIVER
jgi:hypothetical protein